MAVTLATFLPQVLVKVPKCPTILAEDKILDAAQAFCLETQVWELKSETTYSSGDSFEITLPEHADLITVQDVFLNKAPLRAGRDYQVSTIEDVVAIDIRCERRAGDVLQLVLILKPKDQAPTLPTFLWREYRNAVTYKALADLMEMSGQPWSDAAMSMHYEGKYRKEKGTALAKIIKRGTNAPLSVYSREFGF